MNLKRQLISILFLVLTVSLASRGDVTACLPLIPLPEKAELGSGQFIIPARSSLVMPPATDRDWADTVDLFAQIVEDRHGIEIDLVLVPKSVAGPVPIVVETDRLGIGRSDGSPFPAGFTDEHYMLSVDSGGVMIKAATVHGLHNAFMTLLQLMDDQGGRVVVPAVNLLTGLGSCGAV